MYENSFDIIKDLNNAEYCYVKASEYGSAVALYHLGLFYKNKNPLKAIHYFKLSGNSESFLQLGKMYQKGLGCEKNYTKAKKFYKLSSKHNNNSEAFLLLGNLYFKGKGVKQNYIKAIQCYKHSSELKNSKALLKLGIIYYFGKGVDFDISLSINYYLNFISIERQNKYFQPLYYRACNDIGFISLIEYQDKQTAQEYITESGTNEYPIGQNSYAVFLLFYLKKIDRAKEIFKKCSSDNHLSLSNFILAHLLKEENNIDKSIEYLKMTCDDVNKRIIFRGEKIVDEFFQLSQKFVVCFACIILVKHYLLKKQFQDAKKYFICALSNKTDLFLHKDSENIFSSLRIFFLELIESNSMPKQKTFSNFDLKNLSSKKKINENEYKKHDDLFLQELNTNDFLFDSIVKNQTNFNYFIEEVSEIIEKLNNILFNPPYSVIFGRIKYHKQNISNSLQTKDNSENITQSFYDGFNQ